MKKYAVLFVVSLLSLTLYASKNVKLNVHAGSYDRIDCVVSVEIPKWKPNESSEVTLYEKVGKEKKATVCQAIVTKEKKYVLYWVLNGETKANTTRTFIAKRIKKTSNNQNVQFAMTVEDTQKALILKKEEKNILQYNYAHVESPEGVDPAYGKSGFIHPAYSPAGNVLTTIQPKDHHHHYGIWNPWTHLVYDGILYDLWNIGDKKGAVRANKVENIYQGNVFSGFAANLQHFIFTPEKEKMIMDETWDIRAWKVNDEFLWDFESRLYPATSLPVLIQQYRYAGFGYRATEEWTKENSEMFTSEGKNRQEIDGTTARWIYVTGDTKSGRSGLLFLGYPDNYNAPEPLRIWDEKANNGRGDVFINFAPTKNKDWELKPEGSYVLKYRILSYEGEMTSERANRLWNDFAYPPAVNIQ